MNIIEFVAHHLNSYLFTSILLAILQFYCMSPKLQTHSLLILLSSIGFVAHRTKSTPEASYVFGLVSWTMFHLLHIPYELYPFNLFFLWRTISLIAYGTKIHPKKTVSLIIDFWLIDCNSICCTSHTIRAWKVSIVLIDFWPFWIKSHKFTFRIKMILVMRAMPKIVRLEVRNGSTSRGERGAFL